MLLCGAPLLVVALASCGGEPPKPDVPAAPPDEWASLPKSPQWLHAVADFSGPRKAECAEVEKWIVGEAECKGSACEDARDLSRDWLSRCKKLLPDSVEKVKELSTGYEEKAGAADVACTTEKKPLLEGKCGEDKTCEGPAQKWVTRCAAELGSPLGVRILATFVQRRVKDHDVDLDTRPCGELRADIIASVSCGDRFKCEDAITKIETYRGRCEDEGAKPPVSLALAETVIFGAAERKVEPLLASPDDDTSASVKEKLPPQLADGSGVIVSVCGARVATFDDYLAARKDCEGSVVMARAFKLGGGFEVRTGQLPAADTATMVARYPSLLLAGEKERVDKERMAAFEKALADAVAAASDPKADLGGVPALMKVFAGFGRDMYRSAAMHNALKSKDATFVPAFKAVGKLKAKAKGAKAELASIAQRGQKHALADLELDGSVRFGAVSWGAPYDTSVMFPVAHEAYLKELKPFLKKTAKDMPTEEVDADEARTFGTLTEECQTGAAEAKDAEKALLECAFGLRTCDAAQPAALAEKLGKARDRSEMAFLASSIFLTTTVGKATDYYKKIMSTAQCSAPSW